MFLGALMKDTGREIKRTLNRFLSIFAIVALGVGFFAGVKSTCPDMKLTADKYFDDTRLMDLHITSDQGFTGDDLTAIKSQKEYNNISFGYTADALMQTNDTKGVVRILSIPDDKDGEGQALNKPVLVSGRMPQASNECVAEENNAEKHFTFKLGDKIMLEGDSGGVSLSKLVKESEYTVVGFVRTPVYISFERGMSSIGGGTVSCFIMIRPQDFTLPVYTDAYLRAPSVRGMSAFSQEYKDQVASLKTGLEKLGDRLTESNFNETKSDGQKAIDDAQAQLESGNKALSDAKSQIDDAQAKVDQGQSDLNSKQKEYDKGLAAYNQAATQLEAAKTQAGVGGQTADQLQADIDKLKATLASLPPTDPSYQAVTQQVAGLSTLLQKQQELDKQNQNLKTGKAALDKATADLSSAKAKLAASKAEYDKKASEAQPELNSTKQSIEDSQKKLDSLKKANWYVQLRSDNPGYNDFSESADRLAAVASVFPVFFLLVAALVCLTTMSRMVEEQRTQIGTLKALGYSHFSITLKYFIYAALASLLGSALGAAVGVWLFPNIIFQSYTVMFSLPKLMLSIQWLYIISAALVGVLCTVSIALFACYGELSSVPAQLMRPKAPKPGKRILLERIGFLWSKMGFIAKVTSRNLLRYKTRFFMTVIGISGCGALILAGLGLNNSISDVAPKQFNEIYAYNTLVSLKDDVTGNAADSVKSQIDSDSRLSRSMLVRQSVMNAANNGQSLQIYLYVPENAAEFKNYIVMRHRTDGKAVALKDDGVLLTEKAASTLGVGKGDTIELKNNGKTVKVKVDDIVENYVYHNVYISPALYKKAFGEPLKFNTVMARISNDSEKNENQFATDWLKKDNIMAVNFTTYIGNNFRDTIKSLNVVVLVMIISAGCLAFIVLYNLTNINITERLREIATIKVLGFYNNEVSNYVYRENMVLTLVGVAAGLLLGILLHQYVIAKAAVDIIMFGQVIQPASFWLAAALTIVFALFVNFVLYFKLKGISMVESLKSVE